VNVHKNPTALAVGVSDNLCIRWKKKIFGKKVDIDKFEKTNITMKQQIVGEKNDQYP